MKSREFLGHIRENSISIIFVGGKMSATPREKVEPAMKEFNHYRPLLEIRARGTYTDWQGVTHQVRDECGEIGGCWRCIEWYPIYLKDSEHSGLCMSRESAKVALRRQEAKKS